METLSTDGTVCAVTPAKLTSLEKCIKTEKIRVFPFPPRVTTCGNSKNVQNDSQKAKYFTEYGCQ